MITWVKYNIDPQENSKYMKVQKENLKLPTKTAYKNLYKMQKKTKKL